MADKKISALTAASTPLAGTEVLPIVQSGATVKVANNDLRPKQVQSNATSGVLQITGPAAASARVMTTPDANFTVARTDAGQSFTGDQTLATGNLIQGTAGKGFNFTANTPAAGMTSQLMNWYEDGSYTAVFTPATSGSITLDNSFKTLTYTRIGRQVTVTGRIHVSSVSSPVGEVTFNLPFTSASGGSFSAVGGAVSYSLNSKTGYPWVVVGTATAALMTPAFVNIVGADFSGDEQMTITLTYFV